MSYPLLCIFTRFSVSIWWGNFLKFILLILTILYVIQDLRSTWLSRKSWHLDLQSTPHLLAMPAHIASAREVRCTGCSCKGWIVANIFYTSQTKTAPARQNSQRPKQYIPNYTLKHQDQNEVSKEIGVAKRPTFFGGLKTKSSLSTVPMVQIPSH